MRFRHRMEQKTGSPVLFHPRIRKLLHKIFTMKNLNIYIHFKDNCEEAFNFYQSVLGGEYEALSRYGELPPQEGMPPVAEEDKNLILHITLPVGSITKLMGSDMAGGWAAGLNQGNNFAVSLQAESREEADRVFAGLSQEGKITMSMQDTFWGSYFGSFEDKFGISWMINFHNQS